VSVIVETMNVEQHFAKLRSIIKRNGVAFQGVFAVREGEHTFCYTLGLQHHDLPELIMFGLPFKVMQQCLQTAYNLLVVEGRPVAVGVPVEDIATLPVVLIPVTDDMVREYFGIARRFFRRDTFPALQVVWPDRNGAFPWQPGFEKKFLASQPLLSDTSTLAKVYA
jgi:hypothetical protein